MRLQDHNDFTTLQWVKPELDQTLLVAREELESYVDNPENREVMQSFIQYLHQVQGTLQMVELHGAAMVSAEMEALGHALLQDQVGFREEAYTALMRGLMQLPDYLERLSSGHQDVPVVLLPLLNDLRASHDQPPLTESAMFYPDLDAFLPEQAPAAVSEAYAEAHRNELLDLRLQFQQQLLGWFRGQQASQQLIAMRKTLLAICARCYHVHSRRLWWIASGVLEGVEHGVLESRAGDVRQLLGKVDRSILLLIEAGEDSLRDSDADETASSLLYIVAQAEQRSPQMESLRQTYALDSLLAAAGEIEHARGSMSGHNRALLDSVSRALKDDLLRVKEALDLFLRQQDADPAQLADQGAVLERVGDTLGMLALAVPRRVVTEQRRVLDDIANRLRPADEECLLDVAGALLYVEASLDDHIESLGADEPDSDGTSHGLPRSEALGVVTTLMQEAISNTGKVKDAIVAFVEASWEHSRLAGAAGLMDEVAGALRMLSSPRPAELACGVGRFIADELLADRRVPSGEQMDHLADALAALEYYLEAAREHRGGLEHILDVAEHSLGLLGYWPLPAPREAVAVDSEEKEAGGATEVSADADEQGQQPELTEPVSMATGEDATNLFLGASDAPHERKHDIEGLRLAQTEATAPPSSNEAFGDDGEWEQFEEEVLEQVPQRDVLADQVAFNAEAEGIDDDIREIFLEEMQEEIDSLRSAEAAWSEDPSQQKPLVNLRRSFHTLKGSGRLVGAGVLGEFAWKVEDMLNRVLDQTIEADEQVHALVRQSIDALAQMLQALKGEPMGSAPISAIMHVAEQLTAGRPARVEDHLSPGTEVVRRIVKRRGQRAHEAAHEVPAADLVGVVVEGPTADPEIPGLSATMPVMPPVDPVLLEILRSEVAQYLQTIRAAVQHAHGELLIGEELLRAVHTLHGAIAMVEIPLLTQLLSPLEGLVKRLRAADRPLSVEGVQLLGQSADLVDQVMNQFDADEPHLPDAELLTGQVVAMRDAYPEPKLPHVGHEAHWSDRDADLSPEEEAADEEAIDETGTATALDTSMSGVPDADAGNDPAADEEIEGETIQSATDSSDVVEGHVHPAIEFDEAHDQDLTQEPDAALDGAEATGTESEEYVHGGARQGEAAQASGELANVDAEETEVARIQAERVEAERVEAERIEAEKVEAEKVEAEKVEAEKAEAARIEAERLEAEKVQAEKVQAERIEAEKLEAEQAETARIEAERVEAEKVQAERIEAEKLEAEQADAARIEAEQADAARIEAEKAEAEKAEAERIEAEKLEAEQAGAARIEAERVEAEKVQAERVEAEKLEAEQADAARIEAEKVEAEKAEAARIEADKLEAEKPEAASLEAGGVEPEGAGAENAEPQASADGDVETSEGSNAFAAIDADLLEVFIDEAREILDHADGVLAQWHDEPGEFKHVPELQRDLHTLKGGARIAGFSGVGDLAHAIETLLEKPVQDEAHAVPLIGELETSFDMLHSMVQNVSQGETLAYPQQRIDQLLALAGEKAFADDALLAAVAMPEPTVLQARPKPEKTARYADSDLPELLPEMEEEVRSSQEQIRVRADLLDSLVNHAGEVAIYRSRLEQQVAGYRFNLVELDQTVIRLRSQLRQLEIETEAQIIARFQRENREAGMAVFDPLELDRFSQLQQYSRALAESVSDLVSLQGALDELTRQSETLLIQQSRVSTELQDGLLRTRMVPFDTMVPNLRRTLRQAAQEQGKHAQLYVDGAHGEMDRNLLDRIKAPFEHMLRNAVVHGLESPAERRKAGKPAEGSVHIRVAREATEVVIRVSDDGRGLNRKAIRKRGIERGLLHPNTKPSDNQLLSLITQPGFSTASKVTQLAGRGVGMDVVANEIKQLGGSLSIESEEGKGTVFVLRLPFTLAVTQAILVRIGEATFAIPMTSVQGVARLNPEDLAARMAEDDPSFEYAGDDYGIHDLAELLGLPPGLPDDDQQPLLLTRAGDLRAAIRIDAVLGSREIVVKSVGPQISSVPGLLGATIMGDGSVLIILDLAPLVRHGTTRRQQRLADGLSAVEPPTIEEIRVRPLVMVVDDSITMRKVAGRVLERHEYEVSTAKDGIDAIEKLHERVPDLMLLDIEMPRMDGYELATHMKADARLRNVPIIMITSRTGDKHRQRAFDIGVDRYVGKPYQEADLLAQIAEVLQQVAESNND